MGGKNQLGVVTVRFRAMEVIQKKPDQERMQACVQFIHKKNKALFQDIQPWACQVKKLS
jgi:hypothetical protein